MAQSARHIIFICDDNYCMPTIVCIQSIIDNLKKKDIQYVVHIFTLGLNPTNSDMLKRFSSDNLTVVIDVFQDASFYEKVALIKQKSHVTASALLKFELADYFANLDYALYLDSDIIVKDDISDLFDVNMDEKLLAASYEFWKHLHHISYSLSRKVVDRYYFNSGVMLLNLKKFRSEKISGKLWMYKMNYAKTALMDQESLIAVCGHSVELLPVCWNFNPYFLERQYVKEINRVYGTEYRNCDEMLNDVRIIHYVGKEDKPWKYGTARLRKYWDRAFDNSGLAVELQLTDNVSAHRGKMEAVADILKTEGLYGLFSNFIYKLESRIRQRYR